MNVLYSHCKYCTKGINVFTPVTEEKKICPKCAEPKKFEGELTPENIFRLMNNPKDEYLDGFPNKKKVIGYTTIKNITEDSILLCELSSGNHYYSGNFHYRVSTVLFSNGMCYRCPGKTLLFDNRKDARKYINQLKKEFKHFNQSICL